MPCNQYYIYTGEEIGRGTTPNCKFKFSIDPSQITKCNIIFSQNNNVIFIKTLEDCVVDSENLSISVKLTQEETLMFTTKFSMQIQIRIKLTNGTVASSNLLVSNIRPLLEESIF